MVYAQPRICPGEWDIQTSLGFWDTNGSLISIRPPELVEVNKKKRTCWIVDFAIPADHRIKLKESKKKYI